MTTVLRADADVRKSNILCALRGSTFRGFVVAANHASDVWWVSSTMTGVEAV